MNSDTNTPLSTAKATPLEHLLACDPLLGAAIDRVIKALGPLDEESPQPPIESQRPSDLYAALCRVIVGQQLSVAVARTIWNRVVEKFGESPEPATILAASDEELRALGLSRAKVGYLRSLAEHVRDGKLEIDKLAVLSDIQVHEEIVAVKGLGPWSADMFMMFTLHRPDVLPTGDLGIREGFKQVYNLEALPKPAEMIKIAEPWSPYRTLACRYLWRYLDVVRAEKKQG